MRITHFFFCYCQDSSQIVVGLVVVAWYLDCFCSLLCLCGVQVAGERRKVQLRSNQLQHPDPASPAQDQNAYAEIVSKIYEAAC